MKPATNRTAKVGWVVDVQNDFSKPEGRLYVKILSDPEDQGAVQVEAQIVEAVQWMRENCAVVVFTMDAHRPDDAEIDALNPDFVNTYPPHCMAYSDDPAEREGAEILEVIRPRNPLVLSRDATPEEAERLAVQAVVEGREVVIEKFRFSVFEGNPVTDHFLRALRTALGADAVEFYVAGHARDVCVTQFIDGAQARDAQGYRIRAIRDAMWGLGLEPESQTLARWARSGAVLHLRDLA